MEENKSRKVIIMSLTGLLIGSLLFIFGISMKESSLPLIINYVVGMLLYISSFLAVYNNNKVQPQGVYKYIMILAIGLAALITFAIINQLM